MLRSEVKVEFHRKRQAGAGKERKELTEPPSHIGFDMGGWGWDFGLRLGLGLVNRIEPDM